LELGRGIGGGGCRGWKKRVEGVRSGSNCNPWNCYGVESRERERERLLFAVRRVRRKNQSVRDMRDLS